MHGYVFPALALCSAGDDALLVDWAQLENEYAPFKFLTSPPREPLQFSRESTEPMLMDLVESALARLSSGSRAHTRKSSPAIGTASRKAWRRKHNLLTA